MTTYPCKMAIKASNGMEVVYSAHEPFAFLHGKHTEYPPGTVEDFCYEHNLIVTPADDGHGYYILAQTLRDATAFKLRFNVEPPIQGVPVLDVERLFRELAQAFCENLILIGNEVNGYHKATGARWVLFRGDDRPHLMIEAAPEDRDTMNEQEV